MKCRWVVILLGAALLAAIGLALAADLIWPSVAGGPVETDGKLTLDLTGMEHGFFRASGAAGGAAYKLRVKYDDATMTYSLDTSGAYEVFPLQFGSGRYTVSLYENTGGKKYASAGLIKLDVELTDELAAFRVPNQIVHYTEASQAVALSQTICAGLNTDRERFEAIQAYVQKNYTYDFVRTFSITGDFLPDIDYCTSSGKGVYLDLAAATACMLRVQGIPAKLVMGTLDKKEHAWNMVMLDGQEVLYDPSMEIGGVRGTNYAVERVY